MKKIVLIFLASLLTFSLVFASESENSNVTTTYSNAYLLVSQEYSWLKCNVDSNLSDSNSVFSQNYLSLILNPQTTNKM
jgi:hypothetical protein